MNTTNYSTHHGSLITRGFVSQRYIINELSKDFNYSQIKKKIKIENIDLDIIKKLKINSIFSDIKFTISKNNKAEIDIFLIIDNEYYLIEVKSGNSHNDNQKCWRIKNILDISKEYLETNYKISPAKIHKIILISDDYKFYPALNDIKLLTLEELQKLLNLNKTFSSNIRKKIHTYDVKKGLV